jgi:hypothetical protein
MTDWLTDTHAYVPMERVWIDHIRYSSTHFQSNQLCLEKILSFSFSS